MKKILALILAILMVLTISACGGTENGGDNGGSSEARPAETGASETESALANTAKLLKIEKKLTIGYIGGSITHGGSAAQKMGNSDLNKEGNLMNNWVNRTSTYFAEKYPDATIETVNVGASNTQTNFGIFRLGSQLMNTDGHDMPDLVFVEFTTNDWIGGDNLKKEIESLLRNIYAANPYTEIVVVSTNVSAGSDSRKLYRSLCEEYGIPFVDVGLKLRSAIREKHGTSDESGVKFYTTDNLHPSAEGYKLYTDYIIEVIEPLLEIKLKSDKLYNIYENLRAPVCSNLITNPKITPANTLTASGNAALVEKPLTMFIYGTDLTDDTVTVVPNYIEMNAGSTVKFEFTGYTFGLLLGFTKNPFKMEYRIDGGEWKTYEMSSYLYEHTQVKILEYTLSDTNHTVEIKVLTDGFRLGGMLTNEK